MPIFKLQSTAPEYRVWLNVSSNRLLLEEDTTLIDSRYMIWLSSLIAKNIDF